MKLQEYLEKRLDPNEIPEIEAQAHLEIKILRLYLQEQLKIRIENNI